MATDAVESMLRQVGQMSRPPLERWHPPLSGTIDIRIDAQGQWFHEGTAMQRAELVKLFASILRFEDGVGFVLVTPVEKWRILVEDAPFVATAMEVRRDESDQPVLCFATNVGEAVCVDAAHPIIVRGGEGAGKPYVQLRPGILARLSRPVYYELACRVVEHAGRSGVWSSGAFFPLDVAPV